MENWPKFISEIVQERKYCDFIDDGLETKM